MGVQVTSKPGVPKKVESELEQVIAALIKDKGEQSVLINGWQIPVVQRIPTGMFEYDLAIGGGFPRGRYSIIYGPEASGKTNDCYCVVAQAQRLPPPCNKAVWVDVEHTFDPKWAAMFGVNVKELVVAKPAYGEEMVDMVDALVRPNEVAIVVVDSIGVVVSTKEIEQSAEAFDVGTGPILVGRMVKRLIMAMERERRRGHHPCVMLVNHIRYKIGVMFGDPERMPGGEALKFLSSMTVRKYAKKEMLKEVHPDMPAFLDVQAVVKKAKVPVTAHAFKYKQCMYPHDTLTVGQTRSWNRVADELKEMGALVKSPKGWRLIPMKQDAPTLSVFQDTYEAEPAYQQQLQQLVIDGYRNRMFLVEEEKDGVAGKKDEKPVAGKTGKG